MSNPEIQFMQAQISDLQNSLERIREERDELRIENSKLESVYDSALKELAIYKQMVERMQIAMSQGLEL
jgi:regulator of replication initiation timing